MVVVDENGVKSFAPNPDVPPISDLYAFMDEYDRIVDENEKRDREMAEQWN